jgi:hypothetical protein
MNDPFEKKRGMVQQLLAMLKNHAANEVDSGLKHPEGEGDMHGLQAEKVEDLPNHEMDKSTPEHEVDTKLVPEGKETANLGYSKGGIVEKVNATDPTPKIHSGPIPYESQSGDGRPDTHGAVEDEAGEPLDSREAADTEESVNPPGRKYAADEEPRSPFASFFGKKKRHSL